MAAIVLLAIVGGGAFFAWSYFARRPAPRWQTEPVHRGALEVTVSATGTIEPVHEVTVSAEVSGRIAQVNADYNDRVRRGQVLATIDPEPTRIRLAQARAQLAASQGALAQARATREQSQQDAQRAEELFSRGVLARQALDAARAGAAQSRAAVESAQAQVSVARAAITAVQTDLQHTDIVSPIDGIVLQRNVEPGQVVAVMFQPPPLFVLAEDLSTMQLVLMIDEADVGRVQAGQLARFTVDAYPGRTFQARLDSVRNAPQTVQGVVSYEAVLTVDNAEGLLRPGMTANAEIVVASDRDVLLVPNAALRFTPPRHPEEHTGARVWVPEENGEPRAVEIETDGTDGRETELTGGPLREGDRVIVDVAQQDDGAASASAGGGGG